MSGGLINEGPFLAFPLVPGRAHPALARMTFAFRPGEAGIFPGSSPPGKRPAVEGFREGVSRSQDALSCTRV
jgi:hypothetical protein